MPIFDIHIVLSVIGAVMILSAAIVGALIFWVAAGRNLRQFVHSNYKLILIAAGVVTIQIGDVSGWLDVRAIGKIVTGGGLWMVVSDLWQNRVRLSRTFPALSQGDALGVGAIAEVASRYLSLLAIAGIGVALRDAESGRVVECNRRYAELLDRHPATLRQQSYSDFVAPEFGAQEQTLRSRLVAGKLPNYEITQKVILPNGQERWLRVWSVLANGGSKTLDIIHDADNEIRTQIELQASVKELEAANYELEGFSYACAHDLKAPLRRISQRLQEAMELGDRAAKDHKITDAIKRCQELQYLIDEILEYARLGQDEISVLAVQLNDVIDSIAHTFDGDAVITIEPLSKVMCNPVHIGRLFSNLFSNAIKHGVYPGQTEPVHIQVKLAAHQVKGFVTVDVIDNGPGIPGHLRSSLFDPFVIGEGSTGIGLGLAICKKIVKAHGGNLTVQSLESGAVFRVQLPCANR